MPSNPRRQLEDWLKQIDVKADVVLDVGGAQLPIKGRTKSWEVIDYAILDLGAPHETKQEPNVFMDINYWGIKRAPFVISEVGGVAMDGSDIIFCLEVMEYIWNPVVAIKNMRRLLQDGGILYISFPFLYPHHNPKGLDYMRDTRWGAEKLLTECGFKIISNTPRIATDAGLEYLAGLYGAEGMRSAAGYDGHDEIGYLIKAIKV